MSETKWSSNDVYYLRDRWTSDVRVSFARRAGEYTTLIKATAEAKRLAKRIGNGACVQIVRVRTQVVAEVES